MNISEQKKAIRQKIKALKAQLSLSEKLEKSQKIVAQLEADEDFQKARIFMIYWAMDDEVQTQQFIRRWAAQKQIILPSVVGENLVLKTFRGTENLISGELFGIPEPEGETFEQISDIELIIVPGVAFDRQNNRLGRGKAYYDKLLRDLRCTKIGVCFDFQLLEKVPTDEFDVKMDNVIFA